MKKNRQMKYTATPQAIPWKTIHAWYFDLDGTLMDTDEPHPQPLLYASEQLDVATEQCVMVGDTPVDILAARRAGAWAVGVLCGFGEEDELWRSGAHIVLPSTADLLQIISQN